MVVGAVVGEFIASDVGLGYVVNYANITLETDVMFAGLLLLSAVGILLFLLIVLAERYVIDRGWSEERALDFGRQILRGNVERIFH